MNHGLNRRQHAFAEGVLAGKTHREAYIDAGYRARGASADAKAARLLRHPKFAAYIAEREPAIVARLEERTEATAERVVREMARIGFADPRRCFTPTGQLLPVHEWDDEIAAAVSSIEVVTRTVPGTDPVEVEYLHKIRFWPKTAAHEQLAKHLGVYRNEPSGDSTAAQLLSVTMRFAASLHLLEGLRLAEAMRFAEQNPEIVEESGRAQGLVLPPPTRGSPA